MIWQPVVLQARQLLLSAALGLALGVWYDLLRGVRRLRPGCTWLMDLLFGLSLLTAVLWLLLLPGQGMLRSYELLSALAGGSVWLWGISPAFLHLWMVLLRKITRFFQLLFAPVTKTLKKFRRIAKKYFSIGGKWSKMICSRSRPSTAHCKRKGGDGHALQRVIAVDQDIDFSDGGVCCRYPGFPAKSGDGPSD